MEIQINNEPVDFTLENEKNLKDIIDYLETWLSESGFVIVSLEKDNLPLNLEDSAVLLSTPLDQIKKLSLQARPVEELFIEHLSTVYQFFSMLQRSIEKDNQSFCKELLKEYPYIKNSLSLYLKRDSIWDGGDTLEELLTKTSEADRFQVINYLDTLISGILERIREAAEPESEIHKVSRSLNTLVPEISNVSILLQSGKDKQAMGILMNFMDAMDKLLRLIPFIKRRNPEIFSEEGGALTDIIKDLNSFLNEIAEAFSVQDTVLIGDLLEYEVAPRISLFLNIFPEKIGGLSG